MLWKRTAQSFCAGGLHDRARLNENPFIAPAFNHGKKYCLYKALDMAAVYGGGRLAGQGGDAAGASRDLRRITGAARRGTPAKVLEKKRTGSVRRAAVQYGNARVRSARTERARRRRVHGPDTYQVWPHTARRCCIGAGAARTVWMPAPEAWVGVRATGAGLRYGRGTIRRSFYETCCEAVRGPARAWRCF